MKVNTSLDQKMKLGFDFELPPLVVPYIKATTKIEDRVSFDIQMLSHKFSDSTGIRTPVIRMMDECTSL